MRFAFLFGMFFCAFGALVAERYGLPSPITHYTDMGFDKVEALVSGEEKAPSLMSAAAMEPAKPAERIVLASNEAAAAPAQPMIANIATADNSSLAVNEEGLDIIKTSRGLHLTATQQQGHWNIGYGHTATAEEGMTLTVPEAESLLISDLQDAEEAVHQMVPVALNDNEYSALVSFIDSVGVQSFVESDVYLHLQEGDRKEAADAMRQHTIARVNGEMVQMPSLVERRERERQLFLSGEDAG